MLRFIINYFIIERGWWNFKDHEENSIVITYLASHISYYNFNQIKEGKYLNQFIMTLDIILVLLTFVDY